MGENAKRLYMPLSPTKREATTFGLGRDIEIVRLHSIDLERDASSITFRVVLALHEPFRPDRRQIRSAGGKFGLCADRRR